jgi:hypothetical protein
MVQAMSPGVGDISLEGGLSRETNKKLFHKEPYIRNLIPRIKSNQTPIYKSPAMMSEQETNAENDETLYSLARNSSMQVYTL